MTRTTWVATAISSAVAVCTGCSYDVTYLISRDELQLARKLHPKAVAALRGDGHQVFLDMRHTLAVPTRAPDPVLIVVEDTRRYRLTVGWSLSGVGALLSVFGATELAEAASCDPVLDTRCEGRARTGYLEVGIAAAMLGVGITYMVMGYRTDPLEIEPEEVKQTLEFDGAP